jgi:hypothetical protein
MSKRAASKKPAAAWQAEESGLGKLAYSRPTLTSIDAQSPRYALACKLLEQEWVRRIEEDRQAHRGEESLG